MDVQDHLEFPAGRDVRAAAFDAEDGCGLPALIAEGASKGDDQETLRTLATAVALGSKLETYALMAVDLEFIAREEHSAYSAEIVEVKKMLQGFKRSLVNAGQ